MTADAKIEAAPTKTKAAEPDAERFRVATMLQHRKLRTWAACAPFVLVWLNATSAIAQTVAYERPAESSTFADETRLAAEILETVEHRTVGIRAEEAESYYRALRQAGDVSYQAQQRAAREFVLLRRDELNRSDPGDARFPVFVDLFKHPERYQGQPVTLVGHVRKVTPFQADPNTQGITDLYECWIFTEGSQTNPAVVVSSQIPDGMPIGDNLVEQVAVTGYFFKMYGYNAQDTTRLAPLIVAGQLEWFPADRAAEPPTLPILLSVAFGLLLAAIVGMVWLTARRNRRRREQSLSQQGNSPPDFSSLAAQADVERRD